MTDAVRGISCTTQGPLKSKTKSSMKRLNIIKPPITIAGLVTKVRSSFDHLIRAVLLLAAVSLAIPKSFGFVEMMRPAMYMGQRVQAPSQSPFFPYFDPVPMLDFQPWAPPVKPKIKTPQEIASWGYIIWQQWAYRSKWEVCYDPFTDAYVGWIEKFWEWDNALGYRYTVEQEMYGAPSYYSSGWMWSGIAKWDREEEGNTAQVRPWYYTNGNGFKCAGTEDSNSGWKLRNFGAQPGPQFEMAVGWDIKSWPYGWYLADAYTQGTVKQYGTWRIIACDRGAVIDITPTWMEVPRNYRLTAYPYLISAYRTLAYNNHSLPEWVEGWE
jgi:hypothetical protein